MSTNTNDLIDMYESGKSVAQISNITGLTVPSIYGRFYKEKFIPYRWGKGNNKVQLPTDEIINLYQSGISENAISKKFGVARTAIRNRLETSGIHIRNQSESEKLKWSKMTTKERKKQVKSANDKIRSMPKSYHVKLSIKQAITKEKSLSKVGAFEQLFIDELKSRGFNPIPQKAVYVYNVDIAIGNTAIEIHVNSGNPESIPAYRKRIVNLLKRGWNVIYVKITKDAFIDIATDQICSFIDFCKSNKSIGSQYRVIRGTGNLISSGSLNGDKLTTVFTSD
jgi:hypothetical protein